MALPAMTFLVGYRAVRVLPIVLQRTIIVSIPSMLDVTQLVEVGLCVVLAFNVAARPSILSLLTRHAEMPLFKRPLVRDSGATGLNGCGSGCSAQGDLGGVCGQRNCCCVSNIGELAVDVCDSKQIVHNEKVIIFLCCYYARHVIVVYILKSEKTIHLKAVLASSNS